MRRLWLLALAIGLQAVGLQASGAGAAPQPDVTLWRLDCGRFANTVPISCYLVRHGHAYMLWDTGLSPDLAHKGEQKVGAHTVTLDESLPEQLAQLGLKPEDIAIVAISHAHFDHVGGAASFPHATLLIGRKDYDTVVNNPSALTSHPQDLTRGLAPWLGGGSRKDLIDGDRDVFGDGSVVMLNTPGHTAGHHSLELRLRHTGTVILAGDLWHSLDEYTNGVSTKNVVDAAQSDASVRRIKAIAAANHATIIISHEGRDIGKLPAFPNAAD